MGSSTDAVARIAELERALAQALERNSRDEGARFNELQIARHIQTAILPRDLSVDGLEVAAMMVPATEVGGDYYDVLPFPSGAWFGIGDVSGHGVGAGMIMLMVQSAVAALTRRSPRSPREVVVDLNKLLFDNIRRRLREKDHVTFSLLRYSLDGTVRFAGAHEDFIIWRAATRRCELVHTPGVWLGAVEFIAEQTQEREVKLQPGDLLVLYTDGLIEARNAERELFGLKRLCATIEELARSPRSVAEICDAVIGRTMQWCATQADDATLLLARYHGDEPDLEIHRDETVLSAEVL